MKTFIKFALKTLILALILFAGYYFFYLLPQKVRQETLAKEYFNILQNRNAYVELIKLDPTSPNYNSQQVDLIAKIKETNQKGLESSKEEVKEIMQIQKGVMDELSGAKTYEEGIAILKSEKSVTLLTRQTNLLLGLERSAKR